MSSETVSLADAKAHFSELTERAAQGDTIVITKRGKPVVQVTRAEAARKPISLTLLRELTATMPYQTQSAAEFMAELREDARY